MKRGGIVWLNGRLVSAERARVPATLPLVLQGMGLYETLRIVRGRAPLVERHIARLARSARELGIRLRRRDWDGSIAELASRNRIASGRARICLGDGVALITCSRLPPGLRAERSRGVPLTTLEQPRAAAALKATSWLPIWWAEREAGGEALLRDSRGALLETTRANLFVLGSRGVETAAPPDVLPGVAREIVLEILTELGVPVRTRAPRLAARASWREVFLTNAVRGVRPVRAIDGVALPAPGAESLTRRLQKALDQRMGL